MGAIGLYWWYLISCGAWSGALDSYHVLLSYHITITAYNHHTDIYSQTYIDTSHMQYGGLDIDDDDDDDDEDELGVNAGKKIVSFMIRQEEVQTVKKSAKEDSKYPLMEEYV